MRSTLAVVCALGVSVAAQATDPVSRTFVAGSGYIVQHGETSVAMDAFTELGINAETASAMQTGRAPFDVDLILVTHTDEDHYDAAPIALNMSANASAVLVGPAAAVTAVRALAPALGAERFVVVYPGLYAPQTMQVAGLSIDTFSFPLPGPENVGYRFRVGELTFVDRATSTSTRPGRTSPARDWPEPRSTF